MTTTAPPLFGDNNGKFRIQIIGNSGAGKSVLAAKLSSILNISAINLDKLYWQPNWKKTPVEEFRHKVQDVMAENHESGWIIDGSYLSALGTNVSEQATDIIWLDPPLLLYLPRIFVRSIARILGLQQPCSPGCPETIRECFFSKKSILLWCLTHHSECRKRGQKLMQEYGISGEVDATHSEQKKMRRIGGWGSELRRWLRDVRAMVGK